MADLAELRRSLDGELFTPASFGYDAIYRPVNVVYREMRPRIVICCRSVSDVVRANGYTRGTEDRVAVRGGGHCFAGRSSTDGIVLDLSGLDGVSVADEGVATIGAGARLGLWYAALHSHSRTLPAWCGPTVGIAGLALGGGIGLLGCTHGLACDRLLGAQVVLADGRVVECDRHREPELFWGLRGAGGGQFGVVTSLRFFTVDGPMTTRIEAHWSDIALEELVSAWQTWAPDAPDELTVNLTLGSEPGTPVQATLFGASTLEEEATRKLVQEFIDQAGVSPTIELRTGLPYHHLKHTFADLDARDLPGRALRIRSEFFSRPMARRTSCRSWPCSPTPGPWARGKSPSPRWAGRATGSPRAPRRSPTAANASCSSTSPTPLTRGSTVPGRPPTPTGRDASTPSRPRARRLGCGIPRGRPRPAAGGQERLRPAPLLRLSPGHLTNRERRDMSKVFIALAVSVDGYITGRDPGAGRGLGDATMLFDWYFDGDTPSQVFEGFRLSEPSARVFDALAGRVGASLAGRNTYDDSEWDHGGTPHPTAPLFVLSHRPAPKNDRQTLVTTGIEDAVAAARAAAGDQDVALMGGGAATAALAAGLVDEVILHQVPILLGAGRPFFQSLPEHVQLRLVEAVPAPGVTHLHYEVVR